MRQAVRATGAPGVIPCPSNAAPAHANTVILRKPHTTKQDHSLGLTPEEWLRAKRGAGIEGTGHSNRRPLDVGPATREDREIYVKPLAVHVDSDEESANWNMILGRHPLQIKNDFAKIDRRYEEMWAETLVDRDTDSDPAMDHIEGPSDEPAQAVAPIDFGHPSADTENEVCRPRRGKKRARRDSSTMPRSRGDGRAGLRLRPRPSRVVRDADEWVPR